MEKAIIPTVSQWLTDVVVGLNLCPFARKPLRAKQIRFKVSKEKDDEALLADLLAELQRLDTTPESELLTTLLIIPNCLQNFADYNQFLDLAEWLLERHGYVGKYQLASFHPDYQFAGTAPDDAENLTNRAPYPILHLLREENLEKMIDVYPNPENIPHNNILRVESLSHEEKLKLFPYIFQLNPERQ
ncbi:DUF1415 domain-containing protein [Microbulbifer sp. OS29]|uniref:DUF1415 domain-containing protein n=1 Tax=Microbulbifer okhotskensis TaxID=2926617 RepID=A0A9X2EP35_9GAMM|nr:DUF1415 domain-containing protein [Microbulbifer okhotskensis]MCO1335155.1 DUF1415 domain-containing protein [Microbulbifer okhotskensis]